MKVDDSLLSLLVSLSSLTPSTHTHTPCRYEVKVPKDETTMVSDLRYGWKKLRKLATDVSDNLTRLQVGGGLEGGGSGRREDGMSLGV